MADGFKTQGPIELRYTAEAVLGPQGLGLAHAPVGQHLRQQKSMLRPCDQEALPQAVRQPVVEHGVGMGILQKLR
ncbi:MAG TPA: hypothetical protein PLM25_08575 [Limnochordia bacterium]|nr:hypothetical protein [Limnochordia bacterium]